MKIQECHIELELYRGMSQYDQNYGGDSRTGNFREMQNYRGQNFRGGYRDNFRNDSFGRGTSRCRETVTSEKIKQAVAGQDQVQE